MKQEKLNVKSAFPYYLLLANAFVFVLLFGGVAMLSGEGILLILLGAIIGSVTLITGIVATIQYVKGNRYQSKFLGLCLILVGLGSIALLLIILNALLHVVI